MSYTGVIPKDLDASRPPGTESISLGDDAIREIKRVLVYLNTIRTITSNVTLDPQDTIVFVDASGGNRTVTLPLTSAVLSSNVGKPIYIKRVDSSSNTVTVSAGSGENIEGASSFNLLAGEAAILFPSSGVWRNLFGTIDGGSL